MTAADEGRLVVRDERLARFIFQKSYLNPDGTPKLNPFLPDKRFELSMTRHLQFTGDELWRIGQMIGTVSCRTLRARADVLAAAFLERKLRVLAAPEQDNPNHAVAVDWPLDKPTQKTIAQEVAATVGKAILAPPC